MGCPKALGPTMRQDAAATENKTAVSKESLEYAIGGPSSWFPFFFFHGIPVVKSGKENSVLLDYVESTPEELGDVLNCKADNETSGFRKSSFCCTNADGLSMMSY